jgi:hypothetical protein
MKTGVTPTPAPDKNEEKEKEKEKKDKRTAAPTPSEAIPYAATADVYEYEAPRSDRPPWLIPVLASAATFVVGITLGALIFGGGGGDKPAPEPAAAVSPPPPAPCPEPAAQPAAAAAAEPAVASAAPAEEAPAEAPAAAEAPGAAAPAPGGLGMGECTARVTSSPSGAAISVDGTPAGTTPTELTGLKCGEPVTVAVAKDRFEPWEKKVSFVAGKGGKVSASLKRPQVKLTVTSTPAGAVVSVGDRPVGKTPVNADVSAYVKSEVTVTLAGYKPFAQSINPKPGKPVKIVAALEKEPPRPKTPIKPAANPAAKTGVSVKGTATTPPKKK